MEAIDYKAHWNKAYSSKPHESLGWYENNVTPTLKMIEKAGLAKDSNVLVVGAGSTTLIDALVEDNYSKLIASDISEVSLDNLKARIKDTNNSVTYIVDDLTAPVQLNEIAHVDMWIDRAVLHFFVEEKDRETYFNLLKKLVKPNGYVLLAEYNLEGAIKCAGLPVHRYNNPLFEKYLGSAFELEATFNHIYTMPSGDLRPYIYSLYKRVK